MITRRKRRTAAKAIFIAAGALFLFSTFAWAADFPSKSISLIVPYAAGGSTDTVARALAKLSAKHFPVPVVVVNQAGGAGNLILRGSCRQQPIEQLLDFAGCGVEPRGKLCIESYVGHVIVDLAACAAGRQRWLLSNGRIGVSGKV